MMRLTLGSRRVKFFLCFHSTVTFLAVNGLIKDIGDTYTQKHRGNISLTRNTAPAKVFTVSRISVVRIGKRAYMEATPLSTDNLNTENTPTL